jgi:glyoxylase-like metal-dependent hydrolase (beta-lactamase superfamily II)
VRDWLNANQVVLLGKQTVVVDSGYSRDAAHTVSLLQAPQALGTHRPDLLVNTHCHSDHMGGNAVLARTYACPVVVPAGERPLIDQWDEEALWLAYADQRCDRFAVDRVIDAGEEYGWGDSRWLAIAAPGHDMHALMFWCEEHRALISGDALWQSGFGVLLPGEGREQRLHATRSTLDAIGKLDARVVIPGHGPPFAGVEAALERAYRRLEALEADETRMVRSLLKTMFVFSLLDRGPLPAAELTAYLSRVPMYRDYSERYLGFAPEQLGRWLVDELMLIGAMERRDGWLVARA